MELDDGLGDWPWSQAGAYLKSAAATPTFDWQDELNEQYVSLGLYETIKGWLTENFGERCEQFNPNCECCRRWLALDNLFGDTSHGEEAH